MLYCGDEDRWGNLVCFNTRTEAVRYGTLLLKLYNANPTKTENRNRLIDGIGTYPYDNEPVYTFHVGQIEAVRFPDRTDDLLERISQDVYDEFGDYAENYLNDVDEKHQTELQELIRDWAERHNYLPNYFTISRTEMIDIRDFEEV
ncbi:hypothetical protein [Listeria ivanovii]|uniref:hypothetical protein n=1 Tax=Listeria ivanovii TaxID=1638 RepID=UPI003CE71509